MWKMNHITQTRKSLGGANNVSLYWHRAHGNLTGEKKLAEFNFFGNHLLVFFCLCYTLKIWNVWEWNEKLSSLFVSEFEIAPFMELETGLKRLEYCVLFLVEKWSDWIATLVGNTKRYMYEHATTGWFDWAHVNHV